MGWTRGKIGLVTTMLPNRKNPSLCVKDGNKLILVAKFRDSESAEMFDKVLDYLIEGKKWEK